MKRILLISSLLVILLNSSTFAAQSMVTGGYDYSFGLKSSVFDIEYSSEITDSSAWAVRIEDLPTGTGSSSHSTNGIGAGISYRGYFNPTVLTGPYWALGIDAISLAIFTVDPKIELGYFYISRKGITIGIRSYIGYAIATGANTFDGGLGLKIGYGW
ncbi:MAG: hypothetical protein HQK91_11670 [Nitrospirae bacterium]|nr:hypothetical protein [Nitrospirota bacterium]